MGAKLYIASFDAISEDWLDDEHACTPSAQYRTIYPACAGEVHHG